MADVSRRQDADSGDSAEEAKVVRRFGQIPPIWRAERSACVSLSREVFSLKAVLAAAYKFSARCIVIVDSDGDSRWAAYLSVADEAVLDSLVGEFCNELTDQQLRVVLEKEFGELRTLIVAQAFSEGNLLDPDRETADDKADPRGTRIRR